MFFNLITRLQSHHVGEILLSSIESQIEARTLVLNLLCAAEMVLSAVTNAPNNKMIVDVTCRKTL